MESGDDANVNTNDVEHIFINMIDSFDCKLEP